MCDSDKTRPLELKQKERFKPLVAVTLFLLIVSVVSYPLFISSRPNFSSRPTLYLYCLICFILSFLGSCYCYWISPNKNRIIFRIDENGVFYRDTESHCFGWSELKIVSVVIGGAAVATEVGAPYGAYAISIGIPAIGLGMSMLRFTTDTTPEGREQLEKMPTGVWNGIGKAADVAAGTEHHEFERTADFVDGLIGVGTLTKPQTEIECVTNLITIVQAGDATKKEAEMVQEVRSSRKKNSTPTPTPTTTTTTPQEKVDWRKSLEESMLWKP